MAAEVALALTLLVSAGLLLRSLRAIFAVPSGMNTQNLLVARLPFSPFAAKAERRQSGRAILERLQQLPGMQTVSLASYAPFPQGEVDISPYIPANSAPGTKPVAALPVIASDGYLHALRIPLLHGRFFDERDQAGSLRSPPWVAAIPTRCTGPWSASSPIRAC